MVKVVKAWCESEMSSGSGPGLTRCYLVVQCEIQKKKKSLWLKFSYIHTRHPGWPLATSRQS